MSTIGSAWVMGREYRERNVSNMKDLECQGNALGGCKGLVFSI